MHLHHELQRALADTKIGATTAPLPARSEKQPDAERAPVVTRRVPLLRLSRRERRPTGTLG